MTVLREIKDQATQANESAVRVLRKVLDEAEAGKVETVFIVSFDKGDGYLVDCSMSMNTTLKIGSLERIKAALLGDE
jgi:hypothetical protein